MPDDGPPRFIPDSPGFNEQLQQPAPAARTAEGPDEVAALLERLKRFEERWSLNPAFVEAARQAGFPEPVVPTVFGLLLYAGAEQLARQASVGLFFPPRGGRLPSRAKVLRPAPRPKRPPSGR